MIVPTYETTAKEQEIIINNQRKEIERLNEELEFEKATNKELISTGAELENKLYEEQDKNKRLNNIINESNKMIKKIIEEVYKPVDKEWDNILCIIEDYKLKLQELKGSDKE